MKIIKTLITTILLTSCFTKIKEQPKLEVWETIQKAVKDKNIKYLLEISKDTLNCVECNNGKNKIIKEAFFNNHYEQMHLFKNDEYTYYEEKIDTIKGFNKLYRINYQEENKGNSYTIIYTLLKGDNKVKFQGVFSVP